MLEVVATAPIVAVLVVHIIALLSFVLLFHSNWPLWGQTAGTSVAKEVTDKDVWKQISGLTFSGFLSGRGDE